MYEYPLLNKGLFTLEEKERFVSSVMIISREENNVHRPPGYFISYYLYRSLKIV